MVIGYIRDAQLAAGIPRALVYDRTMYILVSFLLVGLICNALIRPVHSKRLMKVDAEDLLGTAKLTTGSHGIGFGGLSFGALHRLAAGRHPVLLGRLEHAREGRRALQLTASGTPAAPATGASSAGRSGP